MLQMLQITLISHKLAYYAQNYHFSFKLMKMYEEMHYLLEILKKKTCNASMDIYSPAQGKEQPITECESH